ncbi:uncharacterized protein LOC127714556 isoform X2 [Mytilus californianus]|uniref:uncharacterized protein LOC127714556 isoform X1 n=1 Tax=Mytilus californianus TaxID=6549 RepID=UPI002247A84B|nr:uncharacterized protein LOC127714556 isoform X1 [Mytilus californianus]XP_052076600.1 uncharacterized protein LOC127714556 isoform X2 [Mytilus californianus]
MSNYDMNEMTHEHRYPSFHYRLAEFLLGGGGFATVCMANLMSRRPIYSSIYRHAIGIAVGAFVGHQMVEYSNNRSRKLQLLYEDYVTRHPDAFREPDPKPKYKDVLLPWFPTR